MIELTTTMYLVRHGQTEWNVANRFQGRLDSSLTEIGIQQVEQLAIRLKKVPFHRIYVSSSKRAYQTASYLQTERDIELIQTDRLMEMDFSEWEGKTKDEISRLFPEECDLFKSHPARFQTKGSKGESFADVQQRVVSFVHDLLAKHAGEQLLLVSHAVVIKVLVNYFRGGGLDSVWAGPYCHGASVVKLIFSSDGVKIVYEEEGEII